MGCLHWTTLAVRLGTINTVCLESGLISGSFMLMIWSVLCTFHTRTRSELEFLSGLGLISGGGSLGRETVLLDRDGSPLWAVCATEVLGGACQRRPVGGIRASTQTLEGGVSMGR